MRDGALRCIGGGAGCADGAMEDGTREGGGLGQVVGGRIGTQ